MVCTMQDLCDELPEQLNCLWIYFVCGQPIVENVVGAAKDTPKDLLEGFGAGGFRGDLLQHLRELPSWRFLLSGA